MPAVLLAGINQGGHGMNTQEIKAEFIAAYMDYLLADGRDGATSDEAARHLAKARAAADRVLDPLSRDRAALRAHELAGLR
jgi:hypothetical protein